MSKDASYHEAVIQYNDELGDFADELADRIEHKEVSRWTRAIAKQHRFHSGRHKKALEKLKTREAGAVEDTEDGGEGQAIDVDDSSVAPNVDASPDASKAADPVAASSSQGKDA